MADLKSYDVQLGIKVNAISLVLSSICETLSKEEREQILAKINKSTELTKKLSVKDGEPQDSQLIELLDMTNEVACSIVQK